MTRAAATRWPQTREAAKEADLPALAARIAAGDRDRAAFAAFYDVLAPRVFRLVTAILGDGIACEVVHDVFIELWRHAARCPSDPDGPLPWAMGIAYRQAAHRARSLERDIGSSDGMANACCPALRGLTDSQHAAITLSFYGALTWAQAARALGQTPEAIARGQRDALVRLRDADPAKPRTTRRPSPRPSRQP